MKTTYLTLALAAAGFTAAAVAHAQPAPAPTAPPAPPAPTVSADPNAPPPADPNAPTAPTDPNAPPAQGDPNAPPAQGDPNAPPTEGDPNAPPPPPPVAPPPPVTAPTTTPTAPPAFVPPPVITQPTTPPATPAPTAPAAPEKKPGMTMLQRFAATAFWWNNTVGASLLGLAPKERTAPTWNGATGQWEQRSGYIGNEDDFYSQSFTFRPAFFLYRNDTHQVRALANITVNTELTNSNSTTKERQPDFFDIPITIADTISLAGWGGGSGASAAAIARDPTLAGAPEYKLWGVISAQALLPASRASREGGMYMGTSLGLGLRQQIKLFGSSSDYLGNVTFTLSETWQHQFWRASTRTKPDLNIPRQTGGGDRLLSDQLSPGAVVENRLMHTLAMFLPIYGDLMMFSSFQVWNDFPYQLNGTDCDYTVNWGECQSAGPADSKMRATSIFDLSLYYQILPELGVDVGYSNWSGQLGENGQYRNPFYSPSSSFYADVYVFLDQVVKRVTTPSKPPAQVGKR